MPEVASSKGMGQRWIRSSVAQPCVAKLALLMHGILIYDHLS